MYEKDEILNKVTRDYYIMTLCDLEDGYEIPVLEKACEDMFEDGETAMAIGIWWAIEQFKSREYFDTLINGKKSN